jgi:hypothetical protein
VIFPGFKKCPGGRNLPGKIIILGCQKLKLELASLKSQLASQTSDLAKVKNQLADMNIQIGYLEMGSNERVASSTVETVPR